MTSAKDLLAKLPPGSLKISNAPGMMQLDDSSNPGVQQTCLAIKVDMDDRISVWDIRAGKPLPDTMKSLILQDHAILAVRIRYKWLALDYTFWFPIE